MTPWTRSTGGPSPVTRTAQGPNGRSMSVSVVVGVM